MNARLICMLEKSQNPSHTPAQLIIISGGGTQTSVFRKLPRWFQYAGKFWNHWCMHRNSLRHYIPLYRNVIEHRFQDWEFYVLNIWNYYFRAVASICIDKNSAANLLFVYCVLNILLSPWHFLSYVCIWNLF